MQIATSTMTTVAPMIASSPPALPWNVDIHRAMNTMQVAGAIVERDCPSRSNWVSCRRPSTPRGERTGSTFRSVTAARAKAARNALVFIGVLSARDDEKRM